MPRPARPVTKVCPSCNKEFVVSYGQRVQRFCSKSCGARRPDTLSVVSCEGCSATFETRIRPSKTKRFCTRSCLNTWKMTRPGARERASRIAKEVTSRPEVLAVLKLRFTTPEARAANSARLRGKTFLARGGNGQLTEPQIRLADALGWPTEHPIITAPVKDQFECLPPSYKVDLADVCLKLAIEVDGRSHLTRKWRFLDRRKEEVLAALGWNVMRFQNERVLNDLDGVVMEIRRFVADPSLRDSALKDVLARATAKRAKTRKVAS